MKISRKSEYACLALIDLAKNYDKGVVRISEIAGRNDIPRKFLEQILLLLKGTGYVRSTRGAGGGYRLAREPESITLAEVIRLIEGPLASVDSASVHFYNYSPIERNNKLVEVFKDIRDYVSNKLENITIKDLV